MATSPPVEVRTRITCMLINFRMEDVVNSKRQKGTLLRGEPQKSTAITGFTPMLSIVEKQT
jgi:hypothetical protein